MENKFEFNKIDRTVFEIYNFQFDILSPGFSEWLENSREPLIPFKCKHFISQSIGERIHMSMELSAIHNSQRIS